MHIDGKKGLPSEGHYTSEIDLAKAMPGALKMDSDDVIVHGSEGGDAGLWYTLKGEEVAPAGDFDTIDDPVSGKRWVIYKDKNGNPYILPANEKAKEDGGPSSEKAFLGEALPDGRIPLMVLNEATGESRVLGAAFPQTDPTLANGVKVTSTYDLPDGRVVTVDSAGVHYVSDKEEGSTATVEWDNFTQRFKITQPGGKVEFLEDFTPSGEGISVSGGELQETSSGQFQFIPDTYTPGIHEEAGREFWADRAGGFQELGNIEQPAEIETIQGQQYIRDIGGQLIPVVDALNRTIEQALISGDINKARKFADFRDAPTPERGMELELEFARSPADTFAVSAISRNEMAVAPPPRGQIQRIAPQTDAAIKAHTRMQESISGAGILNDPDFMESLKNPPAPELSDLEKLQARKAELKEAKQIVQLTREIGELEREEAGGFAKTVSGGIKPGAPGSRVGTAANPIGRDRVTDAGAGSAGSAGSAGASTSYPGNRANVQWTAEERDASYEAGYDAVMGILDKYNVIPRVPGDSGQARNNAYNRAVDQMRRDGFDPGHPDFVARVSAYMTDLAIGGQYDPNIAATQAWLDANKPPRFPQHKPKPGEMPPAGTTFADALKGGYTGEGITQFTDEAGRVHKAASTSDEDIQAAIAAKNAANQDINEAAKYTMPWSDTGPSAQERAAAQVTLRAEELALETAANTRAAQQADRNRRIQEEADAASALSLAASQLQQGQSVIGYTPYDDDLEDELSFDEQVTAAQEQAAEAPASAPDSTMASATESSPSERESWEGRMGWAGGGPVFRDTLALVGEEGPEYVKLPQGARVIPADVTREMQRGRRPKPMAEGGLVFDTSANLGWPDVFSIGGDRGAILHPDVTDPDDPRYGKRRDPFLTTAQGQAALRGDTSLGQANVPWWTEEQFRQGLSAGDPWSTVQGDFTRPSAPVAPRDWSNLSSTQVPAGVRRVHQGLPLAPTRNRLFRAAGLTVPSAQALRNFLPEELEVFREQGRLAGIPEGAFNQELIAGLPAGGAAPRSLALAPRRIRR